MSKTKNNELIVETLLATIDGAANFMRGMAVYPQTSEEVKDALHQKISDLEAITERYSDL